MTAPVVTPYRSAAPAASDGFVRLLWAEWVKFRTVRGWVVGVIVAGLLTVGVGLLSHGECGGQVSPSGPVVTGGPACTSPLGPGGEAVTDNFTFVHQPLAGDGSITARVSSLTGSLSGSPTGVGSAGLQPWAKAGIMIKASVASGSAYAAMMVTGGHGVRMQWNFTHDVAGPVSAGSPRWLRLTRSGDVIRGYDSADGTHWTAVGTAVLSGLPATVPAGLFATSPNYTATTSQSVGSGSSSGVSTEATAAFAGVSLHGAWPAAAWTDTAVGGSGGLAGPGFRQSGAELVVSGSGDIAPAVAAGEGSVATALVGAFAGLIALVVVAAMFITAEFRRGLIRVTLAASPRRGQILAAKTVVLGAVAFVVALPAVVAATLIEEPLARSRGIFIDPVSVLTHVRVLVGTAALLAVAAVLALALGTIFRRSAVTVTAVIVTIVLPYFFAIPLAVLPVGAADWLLRVTPAAGFAIQQPYPVYPQVTASYTPANGYYPLAPWAGFAVLCAWTALALGVAGHLLRRRDA
jgi:ABC-type transport system involved in multi-copper enzyme maturation permease subunit/regulation of enolase protein 1 (concanavalin A-like superfamily)